MISRTLFLPALILAAAPAAAELPEPVRAMIEAAIATGDPAKVTTIVEIARTTNPADGAQIDAMLEAYNAEQSELAAREAAEEQEEIRRAGLFDNWGGTGQIGGFQSTGSTSNVGVTAALALDREGLDWTHKLQLRADYQRTSSVTSREQFLASYEPRFQLNERLFAFGVAQYERNRIQGFSGRYSLSGGIGYKVIDRDTMHLSIKAGPAYRRTEFVNAASTTNIAGLFGADFDWQIAESIKLTQDTNATTEGGGEALVFIDADNINLNLITGLEAKLNSSLTARLSYAIEHDTNPPAGAVKTDTLTRFTLVYGF